MLQCGSHHRMRHVALIDYRRAYIYLISGHATLYARAKWRAGHVHALFTDR